MPDPDGRAVFRQLKADAGPYRIPIIFLTASAAKADLGGLLEPGTAGIFFKPFNSGVLAEQLAEVWRQAAGVGR